MILKRYGNTVQSVDTNFDPRAMTEVGFRRNHALSMRADDFSASYEAVRIEELTAKAEGVVQHDVESEMLQALEERLRSLEASLAEGEVLLVESEQGKDYPKTRERQSTVSDGEHSRLRFFWWIDPPLRVGIYRRKG
jgi:hypothetical protein